VIDEVVQAGCAPIGVVISNACEEISRELSLSDVIVVENRNWKRGIGTSIRAGLGALIESDNKISANKRPFIDAVALLVCDQPFVDRDIIQKLIARRHKSGKPIAVSSYAGTVGVPALFDRICFPVLLALADNTADQPIILPNTGLVSEVPFP
jgi:molybdenum cofactor cytidylyltransferase